MILSRNCRPCRCAGRRRQDPYAPTLIITGLVAKMSDPLVNQEPLLQKLFGVDDFERKVLALVAA